MQAEPTVRRSRARGTAGLEAASDSVLAQRAADGDEVAFGVLVRRHGPYLRAFAARLAGSSLEADDAVQDAFISAWDALPALAEPARVRSWLTTIVVRKVTDRSRRRNLSDPLPDELVIAAAPTASTDPETGAVTADRMNALASVLQELPGDQRRIWLLKEAGGYSYEEIAEGLGLPVPTVRGRLARARATVLERMSGWR